MREVIATDVTLAVAWTPLQREIYRKQWKVSHFSHTIEHHSSGWMWWEKPLRALCERQPLRSAEDPKPPPPRRHGCDCVLWHLEMTWHSLYEWTATTFSFRLRFHSTVTSAGDWYKSGELIINAVRFFIGSLNFYWKGFQLLLLQVPACLLQDFRAIDILSAGDIRKWGQPQRT